VIQAIDAAPPREPPTVDIHGVNHYFGHGDARTQVLRDVNLALVPGQVVFLMGPSGCGKTTLLTLIGALRSVQKGSIRVLGSELFGMSVRQQVQTRRCIGFIFQAHNLFESLNAHRNVKIALELHGGDPAEHSRRAEDILKLLGLGDHIHDKPDSLSGGQKQRVAIARALVNRPKLILADEPTAALDAVSAGTVMKLLKSLTRDDGCTVLMVTHDEKTLEFADRIIKIQRRGRVDRHLRVSTSVQDIPRNDPEHAVGCCR
jgi:putative ABC transport system ATP-binding protein